MTSQINSEKIDNNLLRFLTIKVKSNFKKNS